MTTKLTGPLKREIEVEGLLYTLTITPDALKLVPKGRRKGYELGWKSLVSGEAALAAALNASLLDAPTSDRRPAKRGQSSQQKTRR